MSNPNSKVGRPSGPSPSYGPHQDQILRVATKVFARGGFDAASMRQVASEAGLSVSALYHYFPSKDALMEGVIDRAAAGPRSGVAAVVAPPSASLTDVLSALGAGFFIAAGDPEAKELIQVVFMAAHERPAWSERYLSSLTDPAEGGAARLIEGVLPPGARGRIDPMWLVKQLIGSLLSFVIHEEVLRRHGGNHPARQAYLEQVVDVLASGVEAIAQRGATIDK